MQRRVLSAEPYNASIPLAALAHDVTPTPLHYVRNHFPVPALDTATWRLAIDGHIDTPMDFSLEQLRAMPAKHLVVTMECAGNGRSRMKPLPPGVSWDDGAVSTAKWTGVPLHEVLALVGAREGTVEVLFSGADEGVEHGTPMHFDRAIPLDVAMQPDTILAWSMNGEDLPPLHGSPLRVIVPGWYGVASVKWLRKVTLRSTPFEGWFQKDRYVFEGEQAPGETPEPTTRMRVRALIAAPPESTRATVGTAMRIEGRAWSGEGAITSVEVSTDGGRTFSAARVMTSSGAYEWCRFTFEWTPRKAGKFTIIARATDAAGNVQPLEPAVNRYGYGNNASLPILLDVTSS